MPPPPSSKNLLLIICGPAGSGKTTLCEKLLGEFGHSVTRLVTTTSRDPRPGEVEGVDYHFLPADVFEKKIHTGDFIEWAKVHGRYYGSEKVHIKRLIDSGKDILLNIDIQGAQTFRHEQLVNPEISGWIHCVFIMPKSMEQLRERLIERGTDDEEEIARRLDTARQEIKVAEEFEHVLVSGTREEDYAALRELYLSLKQKSI